VFNIDQCSLDVHRSIVLTKPGHYLRSRRFGVEPIASSQLGGLRFVIPSSMAMKDRVLVRALNMGGVRTFTCGLVEARNSKSSRGLLWLLFPIRMQSLRRNFDEGIVVTSTEP